MRLASDIRTAGDLQAFTSELVTLGVPAGAPVEFGPRHRDESGLIWWGQIAVEYTPGPLNSDDREPERVGSPAPPESDPAP